MKTAVYSLNNKAPGYDEVPSKIWEYGGNDLQHVFTYFDNKNTDSRKNTEWFLEEHNLTIY